MSFLSTLFSIIFPDHCVLCNKKDFLLCQTCILKLKAKPERSGNILSLFSYRDPLVRQLILSFKYRNNPRLGEILGSLLSDNFGEAIYEMAPLEVSNERKLLVVSIPQNKSKTNTRGYNQSSLLAMSLSKAMPDIFEAGVSVLYKAKDTPRQATIKDRVARFENISEAFVVPEKEIGKVIHSPDILVVDDVFTTGATLREAERALYIAGAKTVHHIVLAH
ncbi:MAG: hypothetical protein AAB682_00020 [Patescibacteria group bacterium]